MPLDTDLEALRCRAPHSQGLNQFFDQQGFGSLLRRQSERLVARWV